MSWFLFIFLELICLRIIYQGVKTLTAKNSSNQRKFWAVVLIVGGLVFAVKHIMELGT